MNTGIKLYLTSSSLYSGLLVFAAWFIGVQEIFLFIVDPLSNWHWMLLAMIYGLVPIDQFAHNVLSHRMVQVNPRRFMSRLLLFVATTQMGLGRVKNFIVFHNAHHVYSDQPLKDPLYYNKWYHTVFMETLNPLSQLFVPVLDMSAINRISKKIESGNQDLFNDPWFKFCNNHYILLTSVYWLGLLIVFPIFLFKVVFVGRVLMGIGNALMVHWHLPGDRQEQSNSCAQNRLFAHYLFLGLVSSMLHNNHHTRSIKNGHDTKWYEIDLGFIIFKFLIKPLIT